VEGGWKGRGGGKISPFLVDFTVHLTNIAHKSSIYAYLWRVFKHAPTRRRAHVCLLDIRVTSFRRIFRLPLQIATFIQRIRNVANLFRLNMLFLDGRYSRGETRESRKQGEERVTLTGRTHRCVPDMRDTAGSLLARSRKYI